MLLVLLLRPATTPAAASCYRVCCRRPRLGHCPPSRPVRVGNGLAALANEFGVHCRRGGHAPSRRTLSSLDWLEAPRDDFQLLLASLRFSTLVSRPARLDRSHRKTPVTRKRTEGAPPCPSYNRRPAPLRSHCCAATTGQIPAMISKTIAVKRSATPNFFCSVHALTPPPELPRSPPLRQLLNSYGCNSHISNHGRHGYERFGAYETNATAAALAPMGPLVGHSLLPLFTTPPLTLYRLPPPPPPPLR